MIENEPLPALHQQLLDDETLEALVADLTALAQILEVRGKSGAARHSTAEDLSLADAVDLLRRNDLRGVQVRYVYQGEEWLDSLIHSSGGILLTRMNMTQVDKPEA